MQFALNYPNRRYPYDNVFRPLQRHHQVTWDMNTYATCECRWPTALRGRFQMLLQLLRNDGNAEGYTMSKATGNNPSEVPRNSSLRSTGFIHTISGGTHICFQTIALEICLKCKYEEQLIRSFEIMSHLKMLRTLKSERLWTYVVEQNDLFFKSNYSTSVSPIGCGF